MSIATYLNTGLAILGWAYIMVKTGQWVTKNALRQWDKRRKESRRQKAVNEFYDAFELNSLEPGSTVRLATKGDLTIMMFRAREKPMTDITELAQSLKAAADREMICRDGAETSEIWERTVTPENILALVEALESEKRICATWRKIAESTGEKLEKAQQRTVTFKLPFTPEPSAYSPWVAKAFYQFHRDTVKSCFAVFSDACAAAGIKVEVE